MQSTIDRCNSHDDYSWCRETEPVDPGHDKMLQRAYLHQHGPTRPKQPWRAYAPQGGAKKRNWRTFPYMAVKPSARDITTGELDALCGPEGWHIVKEGW